MSNASYYLLKNGFILRVESPLDLSKMPSSLAKNLYDQNNTVSMNQDEANHRVLFFRDEIIEQDEYEAKFNTIAC